LYNCTRFLMNEHYKEENVVENKKRSIPYASEEMIEHAKSLLQVPKKSIKKTYKVHANSVAGQGGYGSVIIVKTPHSGDRFAAKRLPHDTERNIESNLSEIAYLELCKNHPNIVQFKESFYVAEKKKVWIIMEYLPGGTLQQASKSRLFFRDPYCIYSQRSINGIRIFT